MTDLDFLRFIMASPATTTAGGQGGMGQQLFPELLQQLAQMQMQQPSQGIGTNESGYMQLAQMSGYYPWGRDNTRPPPPPGRTRYPLGRRGYVTPELHPIRPKIPGTLDKGLKAGPDREIPWRQLPWWLEV